MKVKMKNPIRDGQNDKTGTSNLDAPIAQLVERCTCNAKVRCSNQRGGKY